MNKKYIIALVIAVIFSNCEISPRKAKADNCELNCSSYSMCWVSSYRYESGMKYLFFVNYNGGSIQVNITKDSLECEYYRKQLKTSGHE